MPIDSKAGNEQALVGKMQIKGVAIATSHRSPPPGIYQWRNRDYSMENVRVRFLFTS